MITEIEAKGDTVPNDLREQLILLMGTPVGTVVFDRDFGMDNSVVDSPMNDLICTTLAAELTDKIERYIPRLTLQEVRAEECGFDGEMRLKVVITYDGKSI